jgi:hypothetical protein
MSRTGSAGVTVQLQCAGVRSATSFPFVSPPGHGLLDGYDLTAHTFTSVPRPGFVRTVSRMFHGLTGDQASAPATITFHVSANYTRTYSETSTFAYVGSPQTVRVPDWRRFAEVDADPIGCKGSGSFQFADPVPAGAAGVHVQPLSAQLPAVSDAELLHRAV